MASVVTFFLYAAVITAITLILTYFSGTTSTRTSRTHGYSETFPARRIRESV